MPVFYFIYHEYGLPMVFQGTEEEFYDTHPKAIIISQELLYVTNV